MQRARCNRTACGEGYHRRMTSIFQGFSDIGHKFPTPRGMGLLLSLFVFTPSFAESNHPYGPDDQISRLSMPKKSPDSAEGGALSGRNGLMISGWFPKSPGLRRSRGWFWLWSWRKARLLVYLNSIPCCFATYPAKHYQCASTPLVRPPLFFAGVR